MKPNNRLYGILLLVSVIMILVSGVIPSMFFQTVFLSIGCGGVASVSIAWLIDIRNYRQIQKENEYKFSLIMDEYVRLIKRLLFVAANECHGLYHDQEERSLQEWLEILCSENRYSNSTMSTMVRRCERLSETISALQGFFERFQEQSAVLILSGYPDIEKILKSFAKQRVYCWGTLNIINASLKDFCKTTEVLYKEFVGTFPDYSKELPEKYNMQTAQKWNC